MSLVSLPAETAISQKRFNYVQSATFWVISAVGFCMALTLSNGAQAFDTLTVAQTLIYDTAHLANTKAGQQLNYRYNSRKTDQDPISDRVLLTVSQANDEEKRDVVLDFLSEDRHMALPDFKAYRGNPVIIAALEHVAQAFGRDTGGGVLYFRNRIRDALADEHTQVEKITTESGGKTVTAERITFSPFAGDTYLADKPEYTNAAFSVTLSDDVPGGVVGINVESSQIDTAGFHYEFTIE